MRAALLLLLCNCTGAMEQYFAQDVVDIHKDIAYAPGDNIRQRLDLTLPRGVDNFPVVVFVHGGFWLHQDRNYFAPVVGLYDNVGIALARRGIGTAVISYRLVPDVMFDDEFADVAAAIAWTHDHIADYGGAADEMVISGHSAGGHMTALAAFDEQRLGFDPSFIRAYAPLSPILDLDQLHDAPPSSDAAIVEQVFGDDRARDSPSTYFRAGIKPLLIVLGGDDLSALRAQIPPAVDQLIALGAPITYLEVPGKTHDDIVLDFDTDADRVADPLALFVHTLTH